MENKCKRCLEEIPSTKRKGIKFCSSVCKSAYWVENKRYIDNKIKKDELLLKAKDSTKYEKSFLELFNTIYK